MSNVTKPDVKVFFLGILAIVLIEVIVNWQDAVQGFNDGFGL